MMSKLVSKVAFTFLVMSASFLTASEPTVQVTTQPAQSKLGLVRDFMIDAMTLEYMGNRPVSSEIDQRIRKILEQAGIEDVENVRVRRFSALAMRENACVIEVFGVRYVYVDEDWFVKLSIEEQEFIIAHETMHLKHKHVNTRIRNAIAVLLLPIVIKEVLKVVSDKYQIASIGMDKVYRDFLIDMGSVGLQFICIFNLFKHARSQELEADREAAKLLNNTNGGKAFFQALGEYYKQVESQLSQQDFLKKKRAFFAKLFATHPAPEDRIKALSYLEEQSITA